MNTYLARKREQYDQIRGAVEALQTRAADEGRDLTDVELTAVTEQGEQLRALHQTITELSEIETRNRQVAELAARVASDTDDTAADRGQPVAGRARTRDRDPGHYTRSSDRSFFADLYTARQGDPAAATRLAEHNRALSTGVAGAGVVPPRWLVDEYDALARQGRGLAAAVRNVPLGDDPRPITLPRQTTGTDAVIAQQATENTHPAETDAWASTTDVVVPKPYSGIQVVSRQMLDMGSPAVDALIYSDMISVYNAKIEAAVGAALVTSAGTAVRTYANEAAVTTAGVQLADDIIDAAIAVRNARKLPADLVAMSVTRYGQFLKLKDTANRPLMPQETAGPMNVIGVGSVAVDGRLQGLGVVATDGLPAGTYPESIVVLRAADTVLFESNVTQFRFEEVAGPESIKLGIWAYAAVIVRQAGKSAKRIVVTAA